MNCYVVEYMSMDAASLLATEIDYSLYEDDDAYIAAYTELIDKLRTCAKAHAQGTDGCPQDLQIAVACWQKAAELEDPESLCALADYYLSVGDDDRAINWLHEVVNVYDLEQPLCTLISLLNKRNSEDDRAELDSLYRSLVSGFPSSEHHYDYARYLLSVDSSLHSLTRRKAVRFLELAAATGHADAAAQLDRLGRR